MEEKSEGIRVKEHQTALGVNFTVAGITGVCVFDEDTLLYYPVPKEYFSIYIEQYKPGLKVTKDLTVTVKAGTTTGSKSTTADTGTVYYVESVTVGTVPSGVTGKFTVKVDDVIVAVDVTLASNTSINIVSIYGNRFRASKVEVIVTLDSAPTSDTDIPLTATVIQKAVAF
jgi:hypothetical protein